VTPTAAVLVLHGFTGTPEHIETNSGWTPFLAARGVVAAYPEGTPVAQGGFGWNTGTHRFSTTGVDDIAYLVAVLRALVERACVDPHRVMITGESNGGAMTLLAACDGRTRPLFVSFAPVIPAIDAGALERCAAGPALSFTALAGKADRTVPYDGVYPASQVPMLAQEAWFAWVVAARNGCEVRAVTRTAIDDGEVITPGVCADPPTLVAVDDGTHTWPGGMRMPGGPAPGRFPANEYLWARSHLAAP
jgi:polyhydroxybutyrate depolymerase